MGVNGRRSDDVDRAVDVVCTAVVLACTANGTLPPRVVFENPGNTSKFTLSYLKTHILSIIQSEFHVVSVAAAAGAVDMHTTIFFINMLNILV